MKHKTEFFHELTKRIKENIDVIESSFNLANVTLIKSKLYNMEPIEYHLSVLVEDDPYIFLGKLIYAIADGQAIKVSNTNIACNLLLELVNLVLDEFEVERIDKIG